MELISREEAMRLLEEDYYASRSREEDERAEVCLLHLIDISNLPAVEERKEGRWIPVDSYSAYGGDEVTWEVHGNPIAYHYCSECKVDAQVDEFGDEILSKYCPNCGAKMKGE